MSHNIKATPELIAEIQNDPLLMKIIKCEWACCPEKILNPPHNRPTYSLMKDVLIAKWRDRHNRKSRR